MAYRDDVAALEARKAVLDGELTAKRRERDEAARLLDEARVIAGAAALFDRGDAWQQRRRRRRNRLLLGVAGLVLALGSVFAYRATRPAKPDKVAMALAQMDTYTSAMCACKDQACTQRVIDDMMKWSQQMAREDHTPPRLSEAQTRRATELGERMATCMQRAMQPAPEPTPTN